ncbi:MAG: DoxX family membrane protein [Pseudomonadota bacterium]
MNDMLRHSLRVILSAAFLYFGLQKLGGFAPAIEMYDRLGFGQAPRFMTGSAETLGASLLWWRGREIYGAILLLGTMCVAIFALLVYLGPPFAPVPHLTLALLIYLWLSYRQITATA